MHVYRFTLCMLLAATWCVSSLAQAQTASYRILVTNDDGIDAPGIAALVHELAKRAEVLVVAPHENQSGSS